MSYMNQIASLPSTTHCIEGKMIIIAPNLSSSFASLLLFNWFNGDNWDCSVKTILNNMYVLMCVYRDVWIYILRL